MIFSVEKVKENQTFKRTFEIRTQVYETKKPKILKWKKFGELTNIPGKC